MPLRTFTDRQGVDWRVWSVTPEPNAAFTLDEEFRAGWLCFERMDGGERRLVGPLGDPEHFVKIPFCQSGLFLNTRRQGRVACARRQPGV